MTINELIKQLQDLPDNLKALPIYINSYEGGFDSLQPYQLELVTLLKTREGSTYYGDYESVSPAEIQHQREFMLNKNKPFLAFVIDRNALAF